MKKLAVLLMVIGLGAPAASAVNVYADGVGLWTDATMWVDTATDAHGNPVTSTPVGAGGVHSIQDPWDPLYVTTDDTVYVQIDSDIVTVPSGVSVECAFIQGPGYNQQDRGPAGWTHYSVNEDQPDPATGGKLEVYGTIDCTQLRVASAGLDGVVNVYDGGTINVNGVFYLPRLNKDYPDADVNIFGGGLIDSLDMNLSMDNGHLAIDIGGISRDRTTPDATELLNYIALGRISAMNGSLVVQPASDGLGGWEVTAVPEPATLSLLVIGGLVAIRRRR